MEPTTDFEGFFKEFDTVLMGRRTYEVARQGGGARMPGMQTVVCSRTLRATDNPDVKIVADAAETVATLKSRAGKDVWLFGGGGLFRSLLDARLVDTVEIGVMPILLSQGVPLLPAGQRSPRLHLADSKTLPSGIVGLTYTVRYGSG